MQKKDFEKAIQYGEEGIKVVNKANQLSTLPSLLQSLGAVYEINNNIPKAKEMYAKTYNVAKQIGLEKATTIATYSLGVHSGKQEREKHFDEALQILKKKSFPASELYSLNESVEGEAEEDVARWLKFAEGTGNKDDVKKKIRAKLAEDDLREEHKYFFSMFDAEALRDMNKTA